MSVPTPAVGPRVPVPRENPLPLAVLGRPVFAIAVTAKPATQGSKAYKGHVMRTLKDGSRKRVPVLADQQDEGGKLAAWRSAVCAVAIAAIRPGWEPLDGPVVMDLIVSLPRTGRTPKVARTLPWTGLDLSKLARAAEDALGTDTAKYPGRHVLVNDSRIVSYRRLDKVFERDPLDSDALRRPGAVIRLWHYPQALLGKVNTDG